MKIEIPEQKKLVHEMQIPIRWGTWTRWAT